MHLTNFEFKAAVKDLAALEKKLLTLDPVFIGEDNQTDTYFNVTKGRLKLREGNIENSLIYYEREDVAQAKESDILLYKFQPEPPLKEILVKVHGIKVIVKKKRKIYFIKNVKFHFDAVENLGTFVEVEAIDDSGYMKVEDLKKQCEKYSDLLGINSSDYVSLSYSDLILEH